MYSIAASGNVTRMRLLETLTPTLPSGWYYDVEHFQRELDAIWYRDWICIGREEAFATDGDYRAVQIGSQSLIVTRSSDGLRAFHNTCRHRGARLCSSEQGRFRNGRIVCPYHTWTYSLDGQLLATPFRLGDGGNEAPAVSLYAVNIDTWRGFVFVNLATEPQQSLPQQLGDEADVVAGWPLEEMTSVHRVVKTVASNWKIYWENYCECYHCPRVHPDLCKVMPAYRHGTSEADDLPGWTRADDGDAETWTADGRSTLPDIPGLPPEDRDSVVTFASFTGMMYIAAHRDFARSVVLLPRGPAEVELSIDWLLPKRSADVQASDLQRIVDFAEQVIDEDSRMCELNQLGLQSTRHEHGMLVEQEYELLDFHNWLRSRLGESRP